jgi:RimJ/RimL family protein N-acetyltransferase
LEITFEPLTVEGLPLLHAWRSRPHVARWWGAAPTSAALKAEYRPMITGEDYTRVYIASADAHPVAMLQTYLWVHEPEWSELIGALPGEAGIDYFIGEPLLTGRGLGPQLVGRFLEEVVFADLSVTGVRTDVNIANPRSWRLLEKLGFTRGPVITRANGGRIYAPHIERAAFRRN